MRCACFRPRSGSRARPPLPITRHSLASTQAHRTPAGLPSLPRLTWHLRASTGGSRTTAFGSSASCPVLPWFLRCYEPVTRCPPNMSTFKGIVAEFPQIRIDYFRHHPEHRAPLACFLSHVHSDHLTGLESLRAPFVYCSAATREVSNCTGLPSSLSRYVPCRRNRKPRLVALVR